MLLITDNLFILTSVIKYFKIQLIFFRNLIAPIVVGITIAAYNTGFFRKITINDVIIRATPSDSIISLVDINAGSLRASFLSKDFFSFNTFICSLINFILGVTSNSSISVFF